MRMGLDSVEPTSANSFIYPMRDSLRWSHIQSKYSGDYELSDISAVSYITRVHCFVVADEDDTTPGRRVGRVPRCMILSAV